MKKLMIIAMMAAVLSVVTTGCSMFSSMSQSHHENKSTTATLAVPLDKLSAAIEKVAPKTGFNASKTKDNILDKEFVGDEIMITAKKVDDNSSKIYIRIGFGGDPTKEGVILAEIKKELGIK